MKHLIEPLLEKYTDEGVRNVLKTCVLFDLNELSGLWRIRKTGDFIYFLIDNNEIKYIGKTIKIEERIKSHKKNKPKFEFALFCRVKKGSLDGLERFLINRASPSWNKQFPPCKTINTNGLTYAFDPNLESEEEIEHNALMYKVHRSMDIVGYEKEKYEEPTKKVIGRGLSGLINEQQNDFHIASNNSNQSELGRVLELKDLIITNLQNTINEYQATNDALQKQVYWLQGQIEFLQQHIIK